MTKYSTLTGVPAAATRLAAVIEESLPKLRHVGEAAAGFAPTGMKWTRKQILGHLIDSAGNNHQRFVRAQYQTEMSFPRYVQDEWVAAQGCGERSWVDLVELWSAFNRHLVHVARRIPESAYGNVCRVASDEPSTLADHVIDYVGHLEHHRAQILGD